MKVSIDTRTLEPGDVFIPVKGARFDGADFIEEALKKGASQILNVNLMDFAKQFRKKLRCEVIVVVGSFGKTTTKDYLKVVLSQKHRVVATKENQNNEIGVPLTVLAADDQTDILIIEAGLRKPGDLARLAKVICPTIVVHTGVGYTHGTFFESAKALARAKSEIFRQALSWEKDAYSKNRKAFISGHHDHVDVLKKRAKEKGFDVYVYQGQSLLQQPFALLEQIGIQFGLSMKDIKQGILNYKPSKHRLVSIPLSGDRLIIDDSYNANPQACCYAIDYLETVQAKRKICVLGDMKELGAFSQKGHERVLKHLKTSGVSVAFFIGKAYQEAPHYSEQFYVFNHYEELKACVMAELKSGDACLVKGSRFWQLEQLVGTLKARY